MAVRNGLGVIGREAVTGVRVCLGFALLLVVGGGALDACCPSVTQSLSTGIKGLFVTTDLHRLALHFVDTHAERRQVLTASL